MSLTALVPAAPAQAEARQLHQTHGTQSLAREGAPGSSSGFQATNELLTLDTSLEQSFPIWFEFPSSPTTFHTLGLPLPPSHPLCSQLRAAHSHLLTKQKLRVRTVPLFPNPQIYPLPPSWSLRDGPSSCPPPPTQHLLRGRPVPNTSRLLCHTILSSPSLQGWSILQISVFWNFPVLDPMFPRRVATPLPSLPSEPSRPATFPSTSASLHPRLTTTPV